MHILEIKPACFCIITKDCLPSYLHRAPKKVIRCLNNSSYGFMVYLVVTTTVFFFIWHVGSTIFVNRNSKKIAIYHIIILLSSPTPAHTYSFRILDAKDTYLFLTINVRDFIWKNLTDSQNHFKKQHMI